MERYENSNLAALKATIARVAYNHSIIMSLSMPFYQFHDAHHGKLIMKISCKTKIYERKLFRNKGPFVSILAFKRTSEEDDEYLYLYTRRNKRRYQIVNNIEKVLGWEKDIASGKIWISLKRPCCNITIWGTANRLKRFLYHLNCVKNSRSPHHDSIIKQNGLISYGSSNSNASLSGEVKVVKVVVKEKSGYPTSQGFPSTTEQLFLRKLNIKSFDRQILCLQSLRILDLSNNKISHLPKEVGTLPHLQQLLLSRNNLGNTFGAEWTWLEQTAIKHNLQMLDISSNSLTELPIQIRNLNALIHLNVSQNRLTYLPHNIKLLRNLRVLDVARNSLSCLPATIMDMRLHLLDVSFMDWMDVTENPKFTGDYIHGDENIRMPNLFELSARSILKYRIIYDTNIIPNTLIKYLDEAIKWCQSCKTALFDCYIRRFILVPRMPAPSFVYEIKSLFRYSPLEFETYFCSSFCISSYVLSQNSNFPLKV